jgi:hypothetical protein
MINLLVALPAEAKPLIRAFALKRQQPDGEFPLYVSQEITLAICGPGDESMQRAISFLLKRQSISVSGWINLGIAGHGALDRGHCLMVDRVTREVTGESWELTSPLLKDIGRSPLICVSQPESTYAENCAYDMESAGFSSALAKASLLHRGQIIKVVSDNLRQPAAEINGKMVTSLIEACIPTLLRLMEQLHSHAAST